MFIFDKKDGKRKQPHEDIEELQETEANYLFEEENEGNIILAIDDRALNDKIMLNIYAMKKSSYLFNV